MNYYERHIGDYLKNTVHLTLLEHGIYTRLLDVYYTREGGIPEPETAKLICARTKEEKTALANVLSEFFYLVDGHWLQERCEEEIAKYNEGEPEREVKKANETNRLKRHREERANLFRALTDAGLHAPWNIGIAELREMVKRLPATQPETFKPPFPATAPATPATATQSPYPDTRHQTPDISSSAAAIARTWWPSPETVTDLKMIHGYAEQWIDQQVPSFVAYWADRNEPRTSFDALFIDHCQVKAKSLRSVS